eukprot:PhM_4_TR11711/c0_g1_i1/m.29604
MECVEHIESILSNEYLLWALARVTPSEMYHDVSQALLSAAMMCGRELILLRSLLDVELQSTRSETKGTLFLRGTSLFSNLLENYTYSVLRPTFQEAFRPVVAKIMQGSSDAVHDYCRDALDALEALAPKLPFAFRATMDTLRRNAMKRYPDVYPTEYSVEPMLGAIVMLRILNPMIAMPVQSELLPQSSMTSDKQRVFVSVSKTLQKLSNHVTTSEDVPDDFPTRLTACFAQLCNTGDAVGSRRHTTTSLPELQESLSMLLQLLRPLVPRASVWLHETYPSLPWYRYLQYDLCGEVLCDNSTTIGSRNENGVVMVQMLGPIFHADDTPVAFDCIMEILRNEPKFIVVFLFGEEHGVASGLPAFSWLRQRLNSEDSLRQRLSLFCVLGCPKAARVTSGGLNLLLSRELWSKTYHVDGFADLYRTCTCTPKALALPWELHLQESTNTVAAASQVSPDVISCRLGEYVALLLTRLYTDLASDSPTCLADVFHSEALQDINTRKLAAMLEECMRDGRTVNLALLSNVQSIGYLVHTYFKELMPREEGLLGRQIEDELCAIVTADLSSTSDMDTSSSCVARALATRLHPTAYSNLRNLLRLIALEVQELEENNEVVEAVCPMLFSDVFVGTHSIDVCRDITLRLVQCVARSVYPLA